MNGAVLALWFIVSVSTFGEPLLGVLKKLGAGNAERFATVQSSAKQVDHGPDCSLFFI